MLATLTCLLWSLCAAPLDSASALELRYNGTLTPAVRGGDGQPVKRFSLYALLTPAENDVRDLVYVTDERGGGSWPWAERFGRIALTATPEGPLRGPRLLQEHNEVPHPIKLRRPLFESHSKLAAGATWREDNLAYEVRQSVKVNDHDAWLVEVTTNFGRKQTLVIAKASGLLLDVEERIFMGQGDEYTLRMQLDSETVLPADKLALQLAVVDQLLDLQAALGRAQGDQSSDLSVAQLEQVAAAAPKLVTAADGTPFSRLVSVIAKDLESQQGRTNELAVLAQKFIGQVAPEFELHSLDGKLIPATERAGKITVLHFWDYQGDPLIEPYGQVGYLDFLHSRRRKLGVQIYGVAVDERFADKPQVPLAQRSVNKLKSFMNISYPLVADDGEVVKLFGDPRRIGARLPLWVVIGSDGKVLHYHVGFYKINPDEGLRELDDLLVKEIQAAQKNK